MGLAYLLLNGISIDGKEFFEILDLVLKIQYCHVLVLYGFHPILLRSKQPVLNRSSFAPFLVPVHQERIAFLLEHNFHSMHFFPLLRLYLRSVVLHKLRLPLDTELLQSELIFP